MRRLRRARPEIPIDPRWTGHFANVPTAPAPGRTGSQGSGGKAASSGPGPRVS